MAKGVPLVPKNLSQSWPKIDQNGNKGRKWNPKLSQFLANFRPFKGYETAFGVWRKAKGVSLIPKIDKDKIWVQYKINLAKMGQKRMKMLKMKP